MEYNKKNQPYTIEGRFQILEDGGVIDYCRIKFFNTKNVQIVRNELVKTGDFEDNSLLPVEDDDFSEVVAKINNSPHGISINAPKINLEGNVTLEDDVATTLTHKHTENDFNDGEHELVESMEQAVDEPVANKIIAINPKGKEIKVEDLEAFCEKNKLDIEVVQAVLDGKQKTHRKWRFKQQ